VHVESAPIDVILFTYPAPSSWRLLTVSDCLTRICRVVG
jgi:hypothetical protein